MYPKQCTCFRALFVLVSSATVFDSEVSFFWSCSVSFFSSEEFCWSVAREDSSVSFSCSCTQERRGRRGRRERKRECGGGKGREEERKGWGKRKDEEGEGRQKIKEN